MVDKKDKPPEPMPDFSDVVSGASSTAPVVEVYETYEVKRGDSLSKIAKHVYGKAGEWRRIFEANTDQIKDPDKIYPGQKLKIPKGEQAKAAPSAQASPAAPAASGPQTAHAAPGAKPLPAGMAPAPAERKKP